jgi:NAD(P)H-flavin reductase
MAEPARDSLYLPAPYRVLERRRETADTWTLELEPGLPFAPGQFTMVYAFGAGEVPVSISGDPRRPDRIVHTVRAVGPTTSAICSAGVLGIRGPYGTAWPLESAEGGDVVVAAGGIGLAPLRGAVYELIARRDRYGRVVLLYGGRSPDQLLYRDELEGWRQSIEVLTTVDTADERWRGSVGVVTTLLSHARLDAASTTAFVCGPEVMMRFTAADLVAAGVAPERVHLSIERNMKCALGQCGRCQLGPTFVCGDGPVYPFPTIQPLLTVPEL